MNTEKLSSSLREKQRVIEILKECLVIGYGSIGTRHARILKDLGHPVSIVTKRKCDEFEVFSNISTALKTRSFDYAVVCNKTSDHYKAVCDLGENEFKGTLLIEKPAFERSSYDLKLSLIAYVAYNFRFHPIIQKIYNLVQNNTIYSMHVYCGQYLPTWRKGDYRKCYSASKNYGGGVLRDLSHELDYINWITGGWQKITATGGKVSSLEIKSDDLFCVLMETKKCPGVSLQINYLDLEPRREIILNGEGFSLKADLVKGTLTIGNDTELYDLDQDYTYSRQHEAALNNHGEYLCSFDQGIEILKLIEAIEVSSQKKIWIEKR